MFVRTRRHTHRRVFYISVALRKKKASLVKNVTGEMSGFLLAAFVTSFNFCEKCICGVMKSQKLGGKDD